MYNIFCVCLFVFFVCLYLFRFCSRDDNAHAFDTDIISEPLLQVGKNATENETDVIRLRR